MKVSILRSLIVGVLPFIGQVQALDIPEPSTSPKECMTWANAQKGRAAKNAARTHCNALQNCVENESEDAESLRECIFNAQETYRLSVGEVAVPRGGGYEGVGEVPGMSSGVVTRVPDSFYEMKGGDRKGWENADVGD